MAERDTTSEPSANTLAELSALADGTLDPTRAATVREQIARSPELSERFAREQRAVHALRATRSDVAPAGLRARIEAERRRAAQPRRPRIVYGGALAAAAAAVVAALVLLLPEGTPGSPPVSEAAALAARGPALSAPGVDQTRTKLNRDVEEVYFPNLDRLGWTASGQRSDKLDGRKAVTVYYDQNGTRIAYTILAAPALHWPGTQTRWLDGTKVQSFRLDDRWVVTWRRGDHTCVLSGSGVSPQTLSQLAAWKPPGLGA